MKHIHLATASIFRIALVSMVLIFFNSCARKLHFAQSTVVPAAAGTVKIKKDKNKNYAVDIDIENLAEVERLQPARKTYVVWIETERNRPKNIGQLKSSSGMFSNKLKASLNTVTPFEPTRVFITAEDDEGISYPNGQTVLSTKEFD